MISRRSPAKLEELPIFGVNPNISSNWLTTWLKQPHQAELMPIWATSKPKESLTAFSGLLSNALKIVAGDIALFTIQLPPIAWTNGADMYSSILLALIPPVGINLTPPKGQRAPSWRLLRHIR